MSMMLYASNLPLTATEQVLAAKFEKFGGVVSVRIDRDGASASRRGAFVEMQTSAGAQRAIDGLNLANFDGRLISVYPAVNAVRRD